MRVGLIWVWVMIIVSWVFMSLMFIAFDYWITNANGLISFIPSDQTDLINYFNTVLIPLWRVFPYVYFAVTILYGVIMTGTPSEGGGYVGYY